MATRARILADYVSSGDELALKAPLASPAFTGSPSVTLGSDATGDVYYRAAGGALTRLATGADGTVLTSTGAASVPAFEAVPAGGEVGQIESFTTANTNSGTESSTWVALDLTDNITPATTSSKILVIVSITGAVLASVQAEAIRYKIYRDSTPVYDAANAWYQNIDANDHFQPGAQPITMCYLDSPSTTSAVAYTVYCQTRLGNSCTYMGTSSAESTITLIEKIS
jgi:hypothetical protein